MPVAYREILEAALHARVPANRKVRLVSANIKGAAMHATNTESLISRFARWKRHGQIVLASLRSARSGVQNGVRRNLIHEIIAIHDVHPRGKPSSKRMTWCPH